MKTRYYLMLLGALPALASASGAPYFESAKPTGIETGATQTVSAPQTEGTPADQTSAIDRTDQQAGAPAAPAATQVRNVVDPRQVECVAKVVIHEAGNQSHQGKVAVAQVIRTRLNDARFPKTACAVIKQPGQFFNVDAYNPSRSTALWQEATAIATDTLSGQGEEVVPGALFFHAVGTGMPGRRRVAQIGGHIFYR